LIGMVMMERVGADFAVVNAGGIRDSLPAGDIRYKDVLTVHPFGNTIGVLEMTGREAWNYLATAARFTPGAGGFSHFAGVELRIVGGELQSARIGGKPLDFAATYRMAINNFVAAGGDGYPIVTKHPGYVNTGFLDAEVLRTYLSIHSPLAVSAFEPGNAVLRH
jgi:5'-nucleotidase/UDP-sugar diphosphatase